MNRDRLRLEHLKSPEQILFRGDPGGGDQSQRTCGPGCWRGEFRGGIVEFGLAEEGVGFSVDEHNRHLLTPEMLERAAGLRDSIVNGWIEVPFETGR